MDALNQFFFRGYPDTAQHAPRHLAEQGLDQVEPGTMRGGERKAETPRYRLQVGLRFPRDMGRMIVQQQANRSLRGVGGIELMQEGNEITAFVAVADNFRHLA